MPGALTCPHRPPCTACPRFGEAGIAVGARVLLEQLVDAQRLPAFGITNGGMCGFRMRARLAIRGRLGSPKIGLFESDSHRVVHIPNCRVQHPLINRVAGVVRRALVDARVTSYSDKAHLGVARYLQVVVERSSQTAQVVIIANSATPEPLAACFDLIRERLGEDLHSLWFNANCARTNTILGPVFMPWCGPPAVIERFGGAAVHYPPGAFGQSNLDVAERMIEYLRGEIATGSRVAEFYAGVGAIGLSVLERACAIQLNEVGEHSLHGLELGVAALDSQDREKVSIVPGSAGAAPWPIGGTDVVIADPPRRGLDQELIDRLNATPPARFLYVSCGLESFHSDVAQLAVSGSLRLTKLHAFNLLPFTEHVETIGTFEPA